MTAERLQKILARAGVSSRRAAEELIRAGRVQLNGEVVHELGTRADAGRDEIRVDGRTIGDAESLRWYVLYKPERVVTTLADPEGRSAVGDFLGGVEERVYPVGRLDYDAEGVLLLTNDGDLAHRLTHPRWGVRRTYLAKVRGEPDDEALARLTAGVRLEDGRARALEATFEQRTPKNTWIRVVVTEGRNHLVKRMCEAIGHPVVRLFRSDHAGIGVAGLKPGDLRALTADEVRSLRRAVEKEAPLPPGGLPRRRRAVRDPILGTAPRGVPPRDRRMSPGDWRRDAASGPRGAGGARSRAPRGAGAELPPRDLRREGAPSRPPRGAPSARESWSDRRGAGSSVREPWADERGRGSPAREPRGNARGAGSSVHEPRSERRGRGSSAREPWGDRRGAGSSTRVTGSEKRGAGPSPRESRSDRRGAGSSPREASDRRGAGSFQREPRAGRREPGPGASAAGGPRSTGSRGPPRGGEPGHPRGRGAADPGRARPGAGGSRPPRNRR